MVVVAVLVRVMKTGRVAAIVGVGVIIAKHRTKARKGSSEDAEYPDSSR